jgi:phosphatidylcholine synthase
MSRFDPAPLRGYLVHAYTASTLVFVTLAVDWILKGQYHLALFAFAITILIDATDGTLARKYRVKETASRIDGELLDNIVDFLSYVMLPMLFMMHAGMLLEPVTLFAAFVMFASAFGFSRTTAKLANQGFFVGFPSYWNIVVFYLFMLGTPPAFNTLLVTLLALLVFVPVKFLYVSRLPKGRMLHVVLGTVWGSMCAAALALGPGDTTTQLLVLSLVYPIYYTVHSFMLDLQQRQERERTLSSSPNN